MPNRAVFDQGGAASGAAARPATGLCLFEARPARARLLSSAD